MPEVPALAERSSPERPDLITARRGLGLLAAAGVAAGGLNYAFVVVMGALLPAREFVAVAAGSGLLLVVGSAAAATVPWLTAQQLVGAGRTATGRASTARAALTTSVGLALCAGAVTALVGSFADPSARAALATSAVLVCLGQAGVGWAQGTARLRLLAGLIVGEVTVRVGLGTVAALLGSGAAGVLWAGTAGGGLLVVQTVVLVRGPLREAAARSWPDATWWRAAAVVGGLRGAVSAVMVVDVIVVALVLPAGRDVADYQLAMSVGRAPVFLATAVAQAYLAVLAARPLAAGPRSETWRRLLSLALPAAAAIATVPSVIVATVLPGGPALPQVLPWASLTGLAMAMVLLVSTWGQVAPRRVPVVLGLVAAVLGQGSLVLWASRGGDLVLVAQVAACGAAVIVVALFVGTSLAARAWPRAVPGPWPVVAVAVLLIASPWPEAWIVVVAVVGCLTFRHLLSAGSDARTAARRA